MKQHLMKSAALALASLGLALAWLPAAGAVGPGDSFTMTVASKATYANAFRTAINVSGTYTCTITSGWTPSPDFSNLGANASQVQGKIVVQGQGGFGGAGSGFPVCDGAPHTWTLELQANVSTPTGGYAATWKGGKAIVSANGGVADGMDCGGMGGPGTSNCLGTQVNQVVQVR